MCRRQYAPAEAEEEAKLGIGEVMGSSDGRCGDYGVGQEAGSQGCGPAVSLFLQYEISPMLFLLGSLPLFLDLYHCFWIFTTGPVTVAAPPN